MTHELKIWPQYYCRVADGSKTFEVRDNDPGFQPGDTVLLKEWKLDYTEYDGGRYTQANALVFKIGYVLPLDDKRVVFSLLPLATEAEETP